MSLTSQQLFRPVLDSSTESRRIFPLVEQLRGHGFIIEFVEPVAGLLCFGYGCHLGSGVLVSTE